MLKASCSHNMKIRSGNGNSNYNTDTSSSDEDAQLKKLHERMCGIGHHLCNDIVTRPSASPGYWLCCLLPLALIVGYCTVFQEQTKCSDILANYKIITITSVTLCVQTISFYIYINLQAKLYKWPIVFIPFICGSCIFKIFLNTSWSFSVLSTVLVIIFYQRCYIRIMHDMPKSFTYGEASIFVQGILLFLINCILILNDVLCENAKQPFGDFTTLNFIMMFALFWLLVVCILLAVFRFLRKPIFFYPLLTIFAVGVTLSPITNKFPIVFLIEFIFVDNKRILIIIFYLGLVGTTVFVISWQLRNSKRASTRVRKVFHLLMVLVYVPGLLYECTFLYVASGVALALIVIFDLLRIFRMPPFGDSLENAFHLFADEKDAGVIAFTPFCLLFGCSIPLWILPCPCFQNETGINPNLLSLFAGILTIGFGDTAASAIGSKFGRTKWRDSPRTLEGSIAYIVAVLLPILSLCLLGILSLTLVQCFVVILATIITCLIEAHTDQVDNLVLPLVFYIIVGLF